ncbi:MAG: hypothetical protein Ct9H300mP19_04210 [Dehalococcoidia bacterium]|nr:MAG: hypothetical protein Ct9H300mP19_04210 [Dehalococcoidia bacterium]
MLFNMSEQEWDDVMDVHLKGTFSVVQPASRIFKEQGGGRIVTLAQYPACMVMVDRQIMAQPKMLSPV